MKDNNDEGGRKRSRKCNKDGIGKGEKKEREDSIRKQTLTSTIRWIYTLGHYIEATVQYMVQYMVLYQ